MKRLSNISVLLVSLLWLASCATPEVQKSSALNAKIQQELKLAAAPKPAAAIPAAVSDALLPPMKIAMPKANAKKLEPRFDLVINNAPATQVLMGIVSGTRYSMLLHPDISGNISVNLKDVTVLEALDSLRDLYGYEYRLDGSRIFILKPGLQMKIYKVNYISGVRKGSSEISVTSGASGDVIANGNSGSTPRNNVQQASKLSMNVKTDFWRDLEENVRTVIGCFVSTETKFESSDIIGRNTSTGSKNQTTFEYDSTRNVNQFRGRNGCEDNKSVILNQVAGTLLVRALPGELRTVEQMLHAMQISIDKQVIIEAKIIDVELNSASQQGINWAIFRNGTHRASLGADTSTIGELGSGSGGILGAKSTLGGMLGTSLIGATGTAFTGGLGLALQIRNFSAMLNFLQTQGNVNVLSSPRISTINNQKAVLKVGKDEQYVTGFDTNTNNNSFNTSGGTTVNTPTPVYSTFFSGISLDVTPQIDDEGNITLHVHPLVSEVTEVEKKTINNQLLPFASNKISETDSVVKVKDGEIVIIGGLMTDSYLDNRSKVTGAGDLPVFGALFRKGGQTSIKRELVIMIKPTIVVDGTWADEISATQHNIENMQSPTSARASADGGN